MATYYLPVTFNVTGAYLSDALPSLYTSSDYDGSLGEFACYIMTGASVSTVNSKISGSSNPDFALTVHRGANSLWIPYSSTSVYARFVVTWLGQNTGYSDALQIKTGTTTSFSATIVPLTGWANNRLLLNSYATYAYNNMTSMIFARQHSGNTGTTGVYFCSSGISGNHPNIQVVSSDGTFYLAGNGEQVFPKLGWIRPNFGGGSVLKTAPTYTVDTTNAVVKIKNNLSYSFTMMYMQIHAYNPSGTDIGEILYVVGNPTISAGATVTATLKTADLGTYYGASYIQFYFSGYPNGGASFKLTVAQSPMQAGAFSLTSGTYSGSFTWQPTHTLITDLTINTINVNINTA